MCVGAVSLFAGLEDGLGLAVMLGSVAGLCFGASMAAYAAWQGQRSSSERPTFEAEGLVLDGPANRRTGAAAVGGWLWLTRGRLVFEPYGLNLTTDVWSVPRQRVLEAEPVRTYGLVPNGLRVVLEGGEAATFVVERRADWLAALNGTEVAISRDA